MLNTPRPKAGFIKYCSFSTLKSIFSQIEAGKPDERLFAGSEGRPKQVAVDGNKRNEYPLRHMLSVLSRKNDMFRKMGMSNIGFPHR